MIHWHVSLQCSPEVPILYGQVVSWWICTLIVLLKTVNIIAELAVCCVWFTSSMVPALLIMVSEVSFHGGRRLLCRNMMALHRYGWRYERRWRVVLMRRSMVCCVQGDQWIMHRYGSRYENMGRVVWYAVCSCWCGGRYENGRKDSVSARSVVHVHRAEA